MTGYNDAMLYSIQDVSETRASDSIGLELFPLRIHLSSPLGVRTSVHDLCHKRINIFTLSAVIQE